MTELIITPYEVDMLETYVESNASVETRAFLSEPSTVTYSAMKVAIESAVSAYSQAQTNAGGVNEYIYIVTMPDGWPAIYVASYRESSQNGWTLFTSKQIYENLNSRPGAMSALLSQSGVAYMRYIFSTADDIYPSGLIKYKRVGESSTNPMGLIWSGMYAGDTPRG